MSLIKASVPGEVLRAFTTGLGDFISPGSPLWSLLLNKYTAVQVYNLNLGPFCEIVSAVQIEQLKTLKTLPDDPLPDKNLPGNFFQSSGWRFLAAEGDLYGGCHVGSIISGLPPKLTGFSTAAQVLTATESLNELSNVSLPEPGDFEMRVLRITWLHFEALWLYWKPPGGGTVDSDLRGTDVIVPYIGFVGSSTGGQLSPMDASPLPEFLVAIFPRAQALCAQSLARQASIQKAQARKADELAAKQSSSASALKSQASALDAQAQTAAIAAAHAQVRANINKATAKQIQDALGLTSQEAQRIAAAHAQVAANINEATVEQIQIALGLTSEEAQKIVNYAKDTGFRSREELGKVVDLNKLKGKQIGFGPSSP